MREVFVKIINEYVTEKKEEFTQNKLANFIRSEAKVAIENLDIIDSSIYKVLASPGKGGWANIPWIGIIDTDITKTVEKGYAIGYLFCADMSGVYISLTQGWTYFKNKYGAKEGQKKINQVSNIWRSILSSTLNDFPDTSIDLKDKSTLANGYELAHICGKFYPANEIPSEKELIKDLQKLLCVYRELKGKLGSYSIEEINDYLIVNSNFGLLGLDNKGFVNELDGIESNIENYTKSSLEIAEFPTFSDSTKNQKIREFTTRKNDFLMKSIKQTKLGKAGELMVLNYEINSLKNEGRIDLANKVKHISEEEGDGAGYDILSYEPDGTEKYIEVKTTTGKNDTLFNITENELEFSEKKSLNYYLYRLYDFKKETNTAKCYIFKGNLKPVLNLKVQNYVAYGFKKES